MELLITLLLGLFIIIGAVIVFASKNNHNFVEFSISFAFSVIILLMITDLLPEVFTSFQETNPFIIAILQFILSIGIGIGLSKILDCFIPEHEEDSKHNLEHIGVVASISLVLHNIIEGMAVYTTLQTSFKVGIFTSLGIGLHNIPLGMIIASTFYQTSQSKKKTCLIVGGVSLSTFIGGLFMAFAESILTQGVFLTILLGVTTGMLFYISVLELLPKILHAKNKKTTLSGIALGVFIMLIAMLL